MHLPSGPTIPLQGIYLTDLFPHVYKNMYKVKDVYSSLIYNSKRVETSQCSINHGSLYNEYADIKMRKRELHMLSVLYCLRFAKQGISMLT